MPEKDSGWTPSKCLEAVLEGQRFQRDFGNSDFWSVYNDYYRGNFGGLDYFYNLYFIFVRSIMPTIYYKDPHVNIVPMRTFGPDPNPTRQIGALVLQSIDNILLRRMGVKQTIRDIAYDTLCTSRGIAKVGYSTEYGPQQAAPEPNEKTVRTEFGANVKNKMPWLSRCAPQQFIVPYGTRRMQTAPWLCNVSLRYTEDVKNSKYYKNVKDLSGTHINLLQKWVDQYRLEYNLSEYAEFTEIHEMIDLRKLELMTYLPDLGTEPGMEEKWIREPSTDNIMTKMLGGETPYEDLCFNDDPDFFYGPADFRQLEPLQDEVNETLGQAREHRQISLLRFMFQKGLINPGELAKFMDAQHPGIGIEVNGNPATTIFQLQSHIPPDFPAWEENNREKAREITGVGKQQAGIMQGGRKTAREVMVAQAGFDTRVGEKRDAVAEFIQRVVGKVNKIIANAWTVEDTVPVVGVDGALYWVEFNQEILRGDYSTRIDADELSPTSLQQRRSDVLQMAQTLGGAGVPIDFLLRKLLSLYDDLDIQSILPPGNNGQVLPAGQFVSQQMQLSPEQRAAGAGGAMERMVNASPRVGEATPQMGFGQE